MDERGAEAGIFYLEDDLVERRNWFACALVLATVLLATAGLGGASSVLGLVLVAWLAVGALATVATSLYLYTAEIYPTALRARGIASSNVWVRIAAILAPLGVARVPERGGLGGAFGASATCAGPRLAVCLFGEVVASRGRNLDSLADETIGGVG